MHSKQGWKETTPEGERREVRATRQGGQWTIQSRLKGDEKWTRHDPPSLHDLEELHALLERKYRRRRCALKDVEAVAQMIEKHPAHG
jgi:hypothetical protein